MFLKEGGGCKWMYVYIINMNTDISLNTPITINRTYNSYSFKIYSVTVELFTSCTVYVLINTDDGRQISSFYKLTQQEYLGWMNDDNYLVELAKTKIPDLIQNYNW